MTLDTRKNDMTHDEISGKVIDAAFRMHRSLGPGLLESAYSGIMSYELAQEGLAFEREVAVPVMWNGVPIDVGYRADFVIDDRVILELKALERLESVHKKQLLTYLKVADKRLGLLVNFGEEFLKNGIIRMANGLEE